MLISDVNARISAARERARSEEAAALKGVRARIVKDLESLQAEIGSEHIEADFFDEEGETRCVFTIELDDRSQYGIGLDFVQDTLLVEEYEPPVGVEAGRAKRSGLPAQLLPHAEFIKSLLLDMNELSSYLEWNTVTIKSSDSFTLQD